MKNPLISVIVPVYKTEQYLDRCVQSILTQTYKNLEIILVDDASPDRCPELCDIWAEKDSRIKVMHIENKGVANARNQALKLAGGDYIGFVDSDDYIEPDMYEILLSEFEKNDCDIAMCSYQINDAQKGEDKSERILAADAMKNIAYGEYEYGVLWNKLYKKAAADGIEMPNLSYSEDLVYNYYVFKNAKTVSRNSLKLYHYYQNDSSVVHSTFNEKNYDAVKARKMIMDDISSDVLKPYILKGYLLSCYVFLNQIIMNNKCLDFYDCVRGDILAYKKHILLSSFFGLKDKLKMIMLWLCPALYNKLITKLG